MPASSALVLLLVAAGSQAGLIDGLPSVYGDVASTSPYVSAVPVVQAAVVPILHHHYPVFAPTLRRARALYWFDPTIPAFQTTVYAPSTHHTTLTGTSQGQAASLYYGTLTGEVRPSFYDFGYGAGTHSLSLLSDTSVWKKP
ncbi:hypothetical protein BIW11_08141 [Tropilaelaps mercedesae]|uniref:Uncharacterized protein n=1 Tax=Tropilaelaps mercedesae TaxID=418985 RepID=A0A1V9XQV9_9ACAR|nr:hypothetical protein BIW11_08141 [Tropilaelaps mercedesae]